MANIVGNIPAFTAEETAAPATEEVKEPVAVEAPGTETETPAEPPAAEQPVEIPATPKEPEHAPVPDPVALKQIQSLEGEKQKLLQEIQHLRGTRREIKKEELLVVDKKIDELKDVNPEDVTVIEKVLRSKGYVTKEESSKMFYEAVKQEEVNKFLEKYPEYKPENDSNDLNWSSLLRELGYYRMPDNPHLIQDVLLRAHRGIQSATPSKASAPAQMEVRRQQVRTASVGSGGSQRSAPVKSLDPERRAMLSQGGFTEEDISRIEANL